MKRQLKIDHLLYNSRKKPDYVRHWMSKLQESGGVPITHGLLPLLQQIQSIPCRDFIAGDKPAIYEFDMTTLIPGFLDDILNRDGKPSIAVVVPCVIAQKVNGKRKLMRHVSSVIYFPAEGYYKPGHVVLDTTPLTTADKEALDLMVESVITPLMSDE